MNGGVAFFVWVVVMVLTLKMTAPVGWFDLVIALALASSAAGWIFFQLKKRFGQKQSQ